MEYYFADGDQQRGPKTLEQLSSIGVKPDTLIWHEGMAEWMPANTLPEFASLLSAPNMAAPIRTPVQPLAYQQVSANTGTPNGMAIASLVLGIVGLATMLCDGFGLIPGILAIVLGVLARKEIRRSNGEGYGMATAGLIMGTITVSLVVLVVIALALIVILSHR